MKWDRIEYDDGDGYWLECKFPPIGELCIDSLRGPFQLFWFNGNGDQVISSHATEVEAKAAAARWIGERIARFSNALAAGEQREYEDDGN